MQPSAAATKQEPAAVTRQTSFYVALGTFRPCSPRDGTDGSRASRWPTTTLNWPTRALSLMCRAPSRGFGQVVVGEDEPTVGFVDGGAGQLAVGGVGGVDGERGRVLFPFGCPGPDLVAEVLGELSGGWAVADRAQFPAQVI